MKLIDLDSLDIGMANPAVFENRAHADGWNSLFAILQQAPVVDAEPVQHGQWIEENIRKKSYLRLCTACRKVCYFCGTGCSYKYCPNCGAKMDGGAENG